MPSIAPQPPIHPPHPPVRRRGLRRLLPPGTIQPRFALRRIRRRLTLPRPSRRLVASLLAALLVPALAAGAATAGNGQSPMPFAPISGSAYGQLTAAWGNEPWVIPAGYRQSLVSDEVADLGGGSGLDIYPAADDLTDMNTTNETGPWAGRFLYRTHEVRSNGAVSVVDLRTGQTSILAQQGGSVDRTGVPWRNLDGLRWTPWGTLLFAEEAPQGYLFEITLDPQDPSVATAVQARPTVGRVRHEGIEVGPDGAVYVVDELNGGSIYRFVPDRYGDLSSGQLYALRIRGLSAADQLWNSGHPHTGPFEWVPLDRTQVQIDADVAANAVHATEYGRPEDVERIGQVLYVNNTTEDRTLAIDLRRQTVSTFVAPGLNVPVENRSAGITGFNDPDNLAEGPDGRLWIVEDNVPSDIWVADPDLDRNGAADAVRLFASLRDPGAEGTGIYFGADPQTLFVNIQHTAADRDGTWAITNRP